MKKFFFILFLTINTIKSQNITAIFFDVEAIFTTNDMKAASYVGKINSVRYLGQVGHLPNQEALFRQLKGIKAISTQVTYNKNLEMPLILSDWLAQLQSKKKLKILFNTLFLTKTFLISKLKY